MSFKRVLISSIAGLTFSSAALALGLGTIEQASWLNQPLSARIPLESVAPDKLDALRVTMASEETFERAGVDRPHYLRDIRFEVVDDPAEGAHIRVFTREPFREPFVDFLIELNWPQGRLVREYTLLLDPPRDTDEAPAPPTPARTERTEIEERPMAPEPRAPAAEAAVRDGRYGPVVAGETLWSVADRARQEGVSIHQMAVALFEANPNAFSDGDINRLQRGVTLTVPDREAARTLSGEQAERRFHALAAGTAEVPPAEPDPEEPPAVAEAPDAETLDQQLQILAESERDEEELASLLDGDVEPSEETVGVLRDELLRAREDQASLRSENEALRERLSEMEQEVERLERLLTLETEAVAIPTAPAEPAEAPVAPDQRDPEDPPSEVAEVSEDEDDPAPAPTPTTPQPTGWLEGLSLPVALGGVGILIALLALMLIRRRRAEAGVAAEEVPIQQAPAREAAFAAPGTGAAEAEAEPQPRAEPEDPLQAADRLADGGDLKGARNTLLAALNSVPGRNEYRVRLLEILAEADDREAFDHQARALHERVPGDDDPLWRQAAVVGREYAPDNPLFADAEPDPVPGAGPEEEPEGPLPTLDEASSREHKAADAESLETEQGAGGFDFPMDFPGPDETGASATGTSATEGAENEVPGEETPDTPTRRDDGVGQEGEGLALDFEVDDSWRDQARPHPAAESDATPRDETFDLEFGELSLDDLESSGDVAEPDTGSGPKAPGETPLAGDEPSSAEPPPERGTEAADETPEAPEEGGGEEEIATKLDLARAYVDLGDPDGARELLNEVLEVGNATQQEEARKLLDGL